MTMAATSPTVENVARALDQAREAIAAAGLVEALRTLSRDIWASCLDRYEPDELGDTHMSLGIQASENLYERAQRRYLGDAREHPENHWDVGGLRLTTPRKVLTFELASALGSVRLLAMKTPMADGRSPRWDVLTDWDHESHARFQAAAGNSVALGRYLSPAPGQDELFDAACATREANRDADQAAHPAVMRKLTFMWLWSGDPEGPLTSGWLAVPVLGETPFAGVVRSLWRDEDTDNLAPTRYQHTPTGPRFDERPVTGAELTLKRREPGAEQA